VFSSFLSPTHTRLLARLEHSIPADTVDRNLFIARLGRSLTDLLDGLEPVYGRTNLAPMLAQLLGILLEHHQSRDTELRRLDLERTLAPDWFERPEMIAYVCYTERFAGNLKGVLDRISYLEHLGVKYLHLMPFLQPRPAPHDGGYAVADFRKVRADLGTMQDLEELTHALHAKGISLCCDLVLNHVAQEHEWARKAQQGDQKYRDYFFFYPDRTIPDQYERTLPEIFPDFAPGNFTWDDTSQHWVWTTFNSWQWDLNWANPDVFLEFVDLILWLANKGVDIFRLDAIAFIWKRMGTNCQNLPEVHAITQALRTAVRIVAPAVIFKAEAIVAPNDLIAYLGQGEHFGKISDTAYHNSLMVQIWSSLASRDTRLMTHALQAFPDKPSNTAWNTYLRCHDDIGWAIDDDDARAVGLDGFAHRKFLSDFYSGQFPGSFAHGVVFQENKRTGDRRISGSAASLAGLEQALEEHNDQHAQLALERVLLGHAVVLGFGGIPLLYMGDEIAMLNDRSYLAEPEHAMDNRWIHRPPMDWVRAENAIRNPQSLEGRVYHGIQKLIQARVNTPHVHAAIPTRVLDVRNPHVFGYERIHPLGTLVALYNFSESPQTYPADVLIHRKLYRPVDRITGQSVNISSGFVNLAPYARVWLVQGT
jgi:amylosucrase